MLRRPESLPTESTRLAAVIGDPITHSMSPKLHNAAFTALSALDAGYDIKASGVTLDRFCGSGITSANIAASSVMSGMEDLVVSGGTEMMSLPKKGVLPMGANNPHLQEIHPQSHQGV